MNALDIIIIHITINKTLIVKLLKFKLSKQKNVLKKTTKHIISNIINSTILGTPTLLVIELLIRVITNEIVVNKNITYIGLSKLEIFLILYINCNIKNKDINKHVTTKNIDDLTYNNDNDMIYKITIGINIFIVPNLFFIKLIM